MKVLLLHGDLVTSEGTVLVQQVAETIRTRQEGDHAVLGVTHPSGQPQAAADFSIGQVALRAHPSAPILHALCMRSVAGSAGSAHDAYPMLHAMQHPDAGPYICPSSLPLRRPCS